MNNLVNFVDLVTNRKEIQFLLSDIPEPQFSVYIRKDLLELGVISKELFVCRFLDVTLAFQEYPPQLHKNSYSALFFEQEFQKVGLIWLDVPKDLIQEAVSLSKSPFLR